MRPGEVSRAHGGVLFLDELAEFERRCLQALRQILEVGEVELARAGGTHRLPARFQLVAAMNPCPCGWRFSSQRDCVCDDASVSRYAARVSGPLLDRIDLHVNLPAVRWRDLESKTRERESPDLRSQVERCRLTQIERQGCLNAGLPDGDLDRRVTVEPQALGLVARAVDELGLSARGARRALRVARTGADLAGQERVSRTAMAEALGFRCEVPPAG